MYNDYDDYGDFPKDRFYYLQRKAIFLGKIVVGMVVVLILYEIYKQL